MCWNLHNSQDLSRHNIAFKIHFGPNLGHAAPKYKLYYGHICRTTIFCKPSSPILFVAVFKDYFVRIAYPVVERVSLARKDKSKKGGGKKDDLADGAKLPA